MNKWGTIIGVVLVLAIAGALVHFASEYRGLKDDKERLQKEVKEWQEKQATCNQGMEAAIAECQKKQDNLKETYEEKLRNCDIQWRDKCRSFEICCNDPGTGKNPCPGDSKTCPTAASQEQYMDLYNDMINRRKK